MKRSLLIGFTLLILVAGCVPISRPAEQAAKNNKVLLIAREKSANMELMLTQEVGVMISLLEQAGFDVVVATPSGEVVVGGETTLAADMKLADANVDDYAGFLVPCMAAGQYPIPPDVIAVVEKAGATGKPLAAQQSGRTVLFSAGVVQGKRVAVHAEVVQDGNLITSGSCPYSATPNSPDGTVELTEKFIAALGSAQ